MARPMRAGSRDLRTLWPGEVVRIRALPDITGLDRYQEPGTIIPALPDVGRTEQEGITLFLKELNSPLSIEKPKGRIKGFLFYGNGPKIDIADYAFFDLEDSECYESCGDSPREFRGEVVNVQHANFENTPLTVYEVHNTNVGVGASIVTEAEKGPINEGDLVRIVLKR